MRLLPALLFLLTVAFTRAETVDQLVPAGEALAGWQPADGWSEAGEVVSDPENPRQFKVTAGTGILVSRGKAGYLLTQKAYRDVEVHAEFMIPEQSNSGLYFCGSHEVQIFDSFGKEPEYPGMSCGGIYPEWVKGANVRGHSPRVNVSRPAGEWQTYDVVYRAPRFDAEGNKTANARFEKVMHNGTVVHEDIEVFGTTRSGLREKAEGPLRLQGDHGPVAYRNILIRELDAAD